MGCKTCGGGTKKTLSQPKQQGAVQKQTIRTTERGQLITPKKNGR